MSLRTSPGLPYPQMAISCMLCVGPEQDWAMNNANICFLPFMDNPKPANSKTISTK